MELLTNNPGLQHVAEEIFLNLNSKDLQKCTYVNERWKNIINNPSFYLKKCIQFGIFNKYASEWKKAVQFTENREAFTRHFKAMLDKHEWDFTYFRTNLDDIHPIH